MSTQRLEWPFSKKLILNEIESQADAQRKADLERIPNEIFKYWISDSSGRSCTLLTLGLVTVLIYALENFCVHLLLPLETFCVHL